MYLTAFIISKQIASRLCSCSQFGITFTRKAPGGTTLETIVIVASANLMYGSFPPATESLNTVTEQLEVRRGLRHLNGRTFVTVGNHHDRGPYFTVLLASDTCRRSGLSTSRSNILIEFRWPLKQIEEKLACFLCLYVPVLDNSCGIHDLSESSAQFSPALGIRHDRKGPAKSLPRSCTINSSSGQKKRRYGKRHI